MSVSEDVFNFQKNVWFSVILQITRNLVFDENCHLHFEYQEKCKLQSI